MHAAVKSLLLVACTGLVLGLSTAAPATAAKPCWRLLIDDWYDGTIDNTYPRACYTQALKHLPQDVTQYSSARDDIERALLAVIRGGNGSGGSQDAGIGRAGSHHGEREPERGELAQGSHPPRDRMARAGRRGLHPDAAAHPRGRGLPAPGRRRRELRQPAPARAPAAASAPGLAPSAPSGRRSNVPDPQKTLRASLEGTDGDRRRDHGDHRTNG